MDLGTVDKTDVRVKGHVAISIDNNNKNGEDPQPASRSIFERSSVCLGKFKPYLRILGIFLLLAGYIVYFVFAMMNTEDSGTEPRWRLVAMTTVIALVVFHYFITKIGAYEVCTSNISKAFKQMMSGKLKRVIKWLLYVAMTVFMIVYVVVMVAIRNPGNLWSLIGLVGFPVLLWLYSNNRRKVNWHTVYWGMTLQFVMALLILKTDWGANAIQWIGRRIDEFIELGHSGSVFAFGPTYTDHNFAMRVTVNILAFMVGISVLNHLGIVRFLVHNIGRPLAFCIQITPPEGINLISNMFLHVIESALVIREYLEDMKPSELFVTYAGGLATVGGTSIVVVASIGIPAAQLVAASAMSSPAAIVASKLVFPSTEDEKVPPSSRPETDGDDQTVEFQKEDLPKQPRSYPRKTKSLGDAIVEGIEGWIPLALSLLAFVIAFVMILEFVNRTLTWFGDRVGIEELTVEFISSYLFYPFAFMMGARKEDCLFIGELLGVRTFTFPLLAYQKLLPILQNGADFRKYIQQDVNNTWTYDGKDIHLVGTNQTLVGGVMDSRSEIIAIYSLCGTASLVFMGFVIGALGTLIKHRQQEITGHMVRAMVAGTVASYLTACFAGLLSEDTFITI